MQALIEFIAGFVALLAAATLSQFGIELDARRAPDREIYRVRDCDDGPSAAGLSANPESGKDC